METQPHIAFHKEQEFVGGGGLNSLCRLHNISHLLLDKNSRHPRTNFRTLIISLMEQSTDPLIMFLTDDSMFVNDVNLNEKQLQWIKSNPKQNQFVLRLGKGIDDEGAHYMECCDHLEWNFADNDLHSNYGWRFSVDAHIYAKSAALKLFRRYLFENPNTLEPAINNRCIRQKLFSHAQSLKKPALLSFPIDRVQTIQNSKTLGVSVEKLNDYYLNGYTMRYPYPKNPCHFQNYPETLFFCKDGQEELISVV